MRKTALIQMVFIFAGALGMNAPILQASEVQTSAPAVQRTVNMTNNRFIPGFITIRSGDSVRWVNRSRIRHTVTADPAQATRRRHVRLPHGVNPFDSGLIAPGGVRSRVFTVPGDYTYFCTPHQNAGMIGKIRVLP